MTRDKEFFYPQFPAELIDIGKKLIADLKSNDHYTAHPVFVVQREVMVRGMDPDCSDRVGWFNEDNDLVTCPREISDLNYEYSESNEIPAGYSLEGYSYMWEHVETYLTPQAANERVQNDSKMRVYVESAYRNHEMKLIRSHLICLARAADDASAAKQEASHDNQ